MNAILLDMQATVWHNMGETARSATWSASSFPCHWEQRRGSYRTASGELEAWALEMICNKAGIEKGDKLSFGISSSKTPPQDAFTVVWVDTLPLRGKIHHYEVYAK